MSDNWIRLISEDPWFVPDDVQQARAKARFAEIATNAEIDVEVCDTVQFFDCGGNFERIRCPVCGSEVAVEWWRERMDQDFDEGFRLVKYLLPCCGVLCTLNDLVYEWTQGFGQFVLSVRISNHVMMREEHRKEFEEILRTKLRVIYQHT